MLKIIQKMYQGPIDTSQMFDVITLNKPGIMIHKKLVGKIINKNINIFVL